MNSTGKIDDGGPAFPVKEFPHESGGQFHAQGLSIRDWFAGHALTGLLAHRSGALPSKSPVLAYQLADMMLAERTKGQQKSQMEAAAPELAESLEKALIGGNHLANWLIGRLGPDFADNYPPTADPCNVLKSIGAHDYDIWCCWSALMNGRAALAKARGEQP